MYNYIAICDIGEDYIDVYDTQRIILPYVLFIILMLFEKKVRLLLSLLSIFLFVCLFVLRFYSPVKPMGSCRARSVYLTTRLLGRFSPLSG